MKRLFGKRPSPAMVVALAALVVAMSGTGYAALRIPRNSVGAKQLKKNAVTTKKIKKKNVIRSRIGDKAVGTSQLGDDAVTGAKVLESSLGTVPNASTANGQSVQRIRFRVAPVVGATQVLSLGGLTLNASCGYGPALSVTAATSVNGAIIHSGGTTSTGAGNFPYYDEDDDFNAGEGFDPLDGLTTGSDSAQGTLTYARTDADGVVTATYLADGTGGNCMFAGTAVGNS